MPNITFTPPNNTTNPAAPPVNSSNGGLSAGALAGIILGSILAALLLVALIVFCCVAYRRRKKSTGYSLNQPSPRRSQPNLSAGNNLSPALGGRVARMTALEAQSSDEKIRGAYGDHSDEGSPDSRNLGVAPVASRRRTSLSSNSMLGPLEDSSPSNQVSSPEGFQSGQSEQLPFFKDYYSSDDIHVGDKVATLWAYQPRAADEFELSRGDMLKVVGIWDDGWATGLRISDRAEDYDGKHKAQRDSGLSNVQRDATSPEPQGEVKAFPLVCVCLPDHWRKTIEGGDSPTDTTTATSARQLDTRFPNF